MKKYFLMLALIFALTGCTQNYDFSKTCKYETKTFHLTDSTRINVVYDNEDVIKKATITKNYKALDEDGKDTLKNIKEANDSYNKKYDDNIKVYISKNNQDEFEIKYALDVQKIDNNIGSYDFAQ